MGWHVVKLGDISELITKGTTPTSVGFKFTDSGINFIKVESITTDGKFIPIKFAAITQECNESLKRSQLKEGDLLFSIAGALGRTAIVTKEILPANTNQALAIIRLKSGLQIDKQFLMFALTTGVTADQVEKYRGGVAQQNLSLGQLKSFEIPLPPITEQKRIVAILDQAFADIDKARALTEQNLKNARELFESYLQQVFSQRGEGWGSYRLGDISTRLTNGYVGATKNIYQESGVPYLLAKHVRNNQLKFDGVTYVTDEFNQKNKKSILKKDDVLLVQSGHIGHSAVVGDDHAGHNCHAMIVITLVEGFTGSYLSYYFESPSMVKKFQEIRSGSTVPHLTCKLVKELMIPASSLHKQEEIVRGIQVVRGKVDSLIDIYELKLTALDELKSSMLKKAFSGELTKKQEEAAA